MQHNYTTPTTTTVQNPVIATDGAALYLRAMMEEAEDTGQPVNWQSFDRLYEDALAVDEAQGGYSDWRWA